MKNCCGLNLKKDGTCPAPIASQLLLGDNTLYMVCAHQCAKGRMFSVQVSISDPEGATLLVSEVPFPEVRTARPIPVPSTQPLTGLLSDAGQIHDQRAESDTMP